jgi:hypothetical protein
MLKTGWGTWHLDSTMPNDLNEVRGFWRVTPLADNANHSLVEYAIDLRASGLIMTIFRPMLLKTGIRDATSWLKKHSEARFAEIQQEEALKNAVAEKSPVSTPAN